MIKMIHKLLRRWVRRNNPLKVMNYMDLTKPKIAR